MEKYLGNKRSLLSDIYTFCQENCPDARSVLDIFAGTTNVARMFKEKGFTVYSNDANRFSQVLGRTYLELSHYPEFVGLDELKSDISDFNLKKRLSDDLSKYYDLEDDYKNELININFIESIKVFNFLNSLTDIIPEVDYIFLDYYTQFGNKSNYKSMRGTEGKRNYFSKENAIILDNILYFLKKWKSDAIINDEEFHFILTAIIEEVVLIANVNGTFHDFNRNKLWPNSLQKFYLKIPAVQVDNKVKGFSFCSDSINVASKNNIQVDLLYIDPPYNFRQYTAYYHLLNFIAAFPTIPDIAAYLANLEFVRGQNPKDDFTSDFCFKDKFIDALDTMIEDVNPRYIIMSYYGGRNHWNHWSKEEVPTDTGYKIISNYFSQDKYCQHTSTSIIKLRQNYQSRAGEKKQIIDEYLFFASLNNKLG